MEKPEKHVKDHGLHRVLVDFDGVLATDTWPNRSLGRPIKLGIELLKHYFYGGYEVVIYTARPSSHKESIWDWLVVNDIHDLVYDVVTDKPQAWLYIDDRAWNPTKDKDWKVEDV